MWRSTGHCPGSSQLWVHLPPNVGKATLFGASLRITAEDGRVLVETSLALTKGGSMQAVFVPCIGLAELQRASITAQYNYEHTATTLLVIEPSEWP